MSEALIPCRRWMPGNSISWVYYGAGYNAAVRVANAVVANQTPDPFDVFVAFHYCDFCNFESYVSSIMGNPAERAAHIKDVTDFLGDLENGIVSFVKPDAFIDGNPATSKLDLFEAMVDNLGSPRSRLCCRTTHMLSLRYAASCCFIWRKAVLTGARR